METIFIEFFVSYLLAKFHKKVATIICYLAQAGAKINFLAGVFLKTLTTVEVSMYQTHHE